MSFSLGDIGKKLWEYGGDVGHFFQGAAGAVNNEIHQLPQQTAPAIHQVQQFAAPAIDAGKGIVGSTGSILGMPIDALNLAEANIFHNDSAKAQAQKQLTEGKNNLIGLAQGVPRTGAQIVESLGNPLNTSVQKHLLGEDRTFTPKPGWQQTLLGDAPVDSFAHGYNQDRAKNGTAHALGSVGVDVANAALMAKGGIDTVKGGAKVTMKGVKAIKGPVDVPAPAPIKAPAPVAPTDVAQALNQRISQSGILTGIKEAPVTDRINSQPAPTGVDVTTRTLHYDPKILQEDFDHLYKGKGIELPDGSVLRKVDGETNQSIQGRYLDNLVKFEESHVQGANIGDMAAVRSGEITPKQLDQKAVANAKAGKPAVTLKNPSVNNLIPLEQQARAAARRGVTLKGPDWMDNAPDMPSEKVGKEFLDKLKEEAKQSPNASNPVKINIPEVKPGDYAKARSNAQLASNPIDVATGLAHDAVRKLSQPDKQVFWRAIEDPTLVKKAKEPAKLQKAIDAWKDLSDRSHATDNALGGTTPYRERYAIHDWDLTPDQKAKLVQTKVTADPDSFEGINNISRIHPTIAHGEAAGLKLAGRTPEDIILNYGKSVSSALRRQALIKGVVEADKGQQLNRSFDLRNGKSLQISETAKKELRSMEGLPEMGAPRKAYKAVNKGLKQTLLSLSQFHPINISVLKAAPSLAVSGHPVLAARGAANTFLAISKRYSTKIQTEALRDGTIDAGARIGTPIKFGSDYANEGKLNLGKNGIGERTIFEQQMPAMHIDMVRGVVDDLKSRGISLDSPEARAAGTRVNEIMGFVNQEVRNLDPRVQRGLGDALLAPQFTRSKWATLKGAVSEKGVAGKYSRNAVVGNTAALLAVQFALGALFGQKQDNWRDTLIRALIHPSVATPFHDGKGNTVEFGLPSSYLSEALGLGVNLKRDKDGRLGVEAKPGNVPGNIANYGRARLAVLPSAGLKVATNNDYSEKPLYDPTASTGTKVTQAATSLIAGTLPIGAQGLAHTDFVKNMLPSDSKKILDASESGINPVLKSIGGAFGLSARTDKTVGKGLETTQYFDARNAVRNGLNANDKAAFDTIHPAQKSPVTGDYQVTPTVWDGQEKATTYLSHPSVLAADNKLNLQLEKNGQKIDPFFKLSPDQQQKFLTYSTLNQQDPQKARIEGDNPWMRQFQTRRSDFFSTLPPADPNKPKGPVAYPEASPQVAALQDQYFKLDDPAQKAAFIKNNPDLVAQFAAEDKYNRTVRGIKNLPQYDQYPTPDAETQKILDLYNSLPKSKSAGNFGADNKARSSWIRNNPAAYAQMTNFLTKASLYNLEQSMQQAAFQSQGVDQKGLKAISSLARDIGTIGTDPNGNPIYALGAGTKSGTGSSYSSRKSSSSARPVKGIDPSAGGAYHKSKVSVKKRSTKGLASTVKNRAKAKVSLKKTLT